MESFEAESWGGKVFLTPTGECRPPDHPLSLLWPITALAHAIAVHETDAKPRD